MELGKASLRRNGTNCLQNAVHPDHGLLWTDGKGIYLTPVHLYRDQVENAASTRLGEFEYVRSVHWSSSLEDGSCFMAAVHHQTVTVWRVTGAVPRLAFKQVRKINITPVPQGCLWNPESEVLCLLSRQQCSFYFRHTNNRGSFAFPSLEHEKISCGCWLPDGRRLVLCVGSALLIYTWADLEGSINDFVTAAWRLPGIAGGITAIVPGCHGSVVCASDLPLQTLCTNNNVDSFLVPDLEKRDKGEGDILTPNQGLSPKDSLLNLQPDPKSQVEASAMLTVVQLRTGLQDPTVLTSVRLPGLLSPDLLHFQGESQCVVVGSNTQSTLQVFAMLDNRLLSAGHLALEKEERAKGVCSPESQEARGSHGVLVLVGATAASDSIFPSTNNSASFSLALKFFPVRPEKTRQLSNGHAGYARQTSNSSLTKSESLCEPRSKVRREAYRHARQASYKGERPDHRLRSPDHPSADTRLKLSLASISSGEVHSELVEEITDSPRSLVDEVDGPEHKGLLSEDLETETVNFSDSSPNFQNSELSQKYDISSRSDRERSVSFNTSKSNSVDSSTVVEAGKVPPERSRLRSCHVESSAVVVKPDKMGSHVSKRGGSDLKSASAECLTVVQSRTLETVVEKKQVLKSSLVQSSSSVEQTETFTNEKSNKKKEISPVPSSSSVVTADPTESFTNEKSNKRKERPVNTDSNKEESVAPNQQTCVSQTTTTSPQEPSSAASDKGSNQGDGDAMSVCSSLVSAGSSYGMLEKQIQAQNDQIATLQKRLSDLSVMVEDSTCVFPIKYQDMTEPEAVSIQCIVGGARVTRKFLLDCGRLQLDSVKQAFGLLTVELILDGEPLVLGSNIDGYIPMRFTADTFLQVTGIPVVYSPQFPSKPRSKDIPKS